MEHQFELTANVPITPHDLPLPGGYAPGSDEGRLKLQELMTMCTKLSKQVLDLEKKKDAQAVEILILKKRVESSYDDLNEEDTSKQGRSSDKTESMLCNCSMASKSTSFKGYQTNPSAFTETFLMVVEPSNSSMK
ncbi:hypothetical protein Tco_1455438, partial [Tanacetum coccineum]